LEAVILEGPTLKIDLELPASDVNWDSYQALRRLSPYGPGNPRPVFVTNNLIVENQRLVGQDRSHLQLTLSNAQVSLRAIGFNLTEKARELGIKVGDAVSVAYTLDADHYLGNQSVQLKLKDFRLCQS